MGIDSAALHGSSQRANNDAFGFCDASGVTKTSSSSRFRLWFSRASA